MPMVGCVALQALRDTGKVQPGQKVLINGASGGIGTFSVQIAKWLGADVTGVCSTNNVDLIRSVGPIMSSITHRRISPDLGSVTTSFSISRAHTRCRNTYARSRPQAH